MKLEIIQPFINAADAVLAETLHCAPRMDTVSMDTKDDQRQGISAVVCLQGEIEGRIVLGLETETAHNMALEFAAPDSDVVPLAQDVVCELANQVIGNAITILNDSGYRFRVLPPQVSSTGRVPHSSVDTEALTMKFETESGPVFLNIALHACKAYAAD